MIYRNSDKREIFNADGATGCEVACLANYDIVELEIERGIAPHDVPFEMAFYLLEGTGRCDTAGESHSLARGDVLHLPPGIERGWTNTGKEVLRVLAIRGHVG